MGRATKEETGTEFIEDINFSYIPFFLSKDRIALIYGGAGAGKSYACAQKILLYMKTFTNKKILVLRKTGPALKLTCMSLIRSLLDKYQWDYIENKADWIMNDLICNNTIIYRSVDNAEKLKSLTDVDLIWIEEPTEITEQEFNVINLRLRGRPLDKDEYRQIMLSFNPVSTQSWLYKRFFERNEQAFKQKFTYLDNQFIDSEYIAVLEQLKDQDEYAYKVYTLGEWGLLKGVVYNNYTINKFDYSMDWFDTVIGGIDFGYNNPSAYLLIGIKDDEVYIIDEIYRSHLTNPEFVDLVKNKNSEWKVNPIVYCEHDPGRNLEFARAGIRIIPANKDVSNGINFVRSKKLHIHERCVNTIKEIQGYKYREDKNGNILDEPVKFNDHSMDALRYAVYTHGLSGGMVVNKPRGW